MSMAPVAAACSRILSGASAPAIQSIAWPGPAMKPSSDIALLTTTLPVAVLVSLILFLTATAYADAVTTVDIGLPGHPASPGRIRQFDRFSGAANTALMPPIAGCSFH